MADRLERASILFLSLVALIETTRGEASDLEKDMSRYFVANPRSLDYKFVGKKDEHRFGVELKENKQFHHTKTAEDGVRLGCYGHELEGKKYSTHYVADGKGYRLVPHHGLITVYPKDGSEPRKASFVQSFNEEEIRSANIRYFFPDGCQSPQIEIGALESKPLFPEKKKPDVLIPPIQKKPDEPIEIPSRQVKKPKNIEVNVVSDAPPLQVTASFEKIQPLKQQNEGPKVATDTVVSKTETITVKPEIEIALPVVNETISSVPKTSYIPVPYTTESPETTPTPNPIQPLTKIPITAKPSVDFSKNVFNPEPIAPYKSLENKCSDTCCDDNRPQILMSRASKDSCCKGVSKIVIPIQTEVLGKIPTNEILSIVSETSNVKMLKKLLQLAEKYQL